MTWILDVLHGLIDFQMGLPDLVDILLVTALIYTLLTLLRGTRAMQMLWGLLGLVVALLWLSAGSPDGAQAAGVKPI